MVASCSAGEHFPSFHNSLKSEHNAGMTNLVEAGREDTS